MFEQIAPSIVRSDKGFTISFMTGMTNIQYSDDINNRKLAIPIEPGARMAVYTSNVGNWLPPDQNVPLTDYQIKQIIQDISDALDFFELDYSLM